MKKIFMISREYPPSTSGGAIAIYNYINPIKSYDFFITSYFKPDKTDENVTVKKIKERFKSHRYLSATHFIVSSILSSFRGFDGLIGQALVGSFGASIIKIFRRKPLISMVYDVDSLQKGAANFGPLVRIGRRLVYDLIFACSDIVIVSSMKVKNDIISIFGKKTGEKVTVLPIGVETEPFEKISKPKGKKIVLTTGGIMNKRGLEYLIEGFSASIKEVKDAELWIVGPIIEQDYYEKLTKLVSTLGLENHVKFIGRVLHSSNGGVNIFSYYDACDVFAISSYHSMGYSLTAIEASLMGKPMVATKIIEDVGVINDNTAIIVPNKDSASMGRAITRLLKDDELRKRMGNAGKEFCKKFDIMEIAKEYESIIRSTIERAK